MILPENVQDLITFDAESLRVTSREGKHCEFKQSFDSSQFCKYVKTLSAFSNADGGKIIFGVSDSPRIIFGIDKENIPDDADIGNQFSTHFDPEIKFQTKEYAVSSLLIFVISVSMANNRPVMCKKGKNIEQTRGNRTTNKEVLKEGAIYYRYSAKSELIKYSELNTIIIDRDRKRIQNILETLRLAEKVGYDKVGFVDAGRWGEGSQVSELMITETAAKSLNFIEEGKFVEKSGDGDPAYYVLGKVNLREVVVGVLDDEDKNLPTEVANTLRPEICATFGMSVALTGGQVTKILRRFNLTEMPYSQIDTKLRRTYITRDGIEAIRRHLVDEPLELLRSFSSKSNIELFRRQLEENQ